MADNTTTKPITPSTGGLNYDDYQKTLEQAAASTRKVEGVTSTDVAAKAGASLLGERRQVGSALINQYQQDVVTKKQQAGKAATGLEVTGKATIDYLKNLESIQSSIKSQVQSAGDTWGAAAEKADEYVTASRSRVGEVLKKLDDINQKIGTDRDFAQAHAMQASVQAVLGSMKTEERNIAETYGTNSKEFQQFTASKQTALATVQSNIQANYSQLREQQGQTYLNLVGDAFTKSNMYVGFQEQQHVEMLKFRDQQKNSYALEAAQLEIGIEQMKMAGQENLANWIIQTPTFSMDITPLVMSMGDLAQTQRAEAQAYDTANPTKAKPDLSQTSGWANVGEYNAAQGAIRGQEQRARSTALGY